MGMLYFLYFCDLWMLVFISLVRVFGVLLYYLWIWLKKVFSVVGLVICCLMGLMRMLLVSVVIRLMIFLLVWIGGVWLVGCSRLFFFSVLR